MNKGILKPFDNHIRKAILVLFSLFLFLLPSFTNILSAQLEKGSSTIFYGKKKSIAPSILWNLDDETQTIKTQKQTLTVDAIVKSKFKLKANMFALYKNGKKLPTKLKLENISANDGEYKYQISPQLYTASLKERFYIAFEDGDLSSKSYEISVMYEEKVVEQTPEIVQQDISLELLNRIGETDDKDFVLRFKTNTNIEISAFQNNNKLSSNRLSQNRLTDKLSEYILPMVLKDGKNQIQVKVVDEKGASRSETFDILYKKTKDGDQRKEVVNTIKKPDPNVLTWEKIEAEGIPIKKMEMVEQYLKSGETAHKELSCTLFEKLMWDESNNTEKYDGYFSKLEWFLDFCPDLKAKIKERSLPPINVVSNCEGVDCEVQIEHFIPPLDKNNFTISEGAEIVSIEDNKVSFKLDNPKDKFEISYSDKISRSNSIYLGLENYFNIHFFELNEQSNELTLDITGGNPPLFIQLLSEGKLLKEFNLGKFKEGIIPLSKANILPNQSIEVYVTDANKLTNKLVMDFVSADKDSFFSGPMTLIAVIGAFLMTCLFMFFKYRQAKNKTKEWEAL